jgi:hypothetical protein
MSRKGVAPASSVPEDSFLLRCWWADAEKIPEYPMLWRRPFTIIIPRRAHVDLGLMKKLKEVQPNRMKDINFDDILVWAVASPLDPPTRYVNVDDAMRQAVGEPLSATTLADAFEKIPPNPDHLNLVLKKICTCGLPPRRSYADGMSSFVP